MDKHRLADRSLDYKNRQIEPSGVLESHKSHRMRHSAKLGNDYCEWCGCQRGSWRSRRECEGVEAENDSKGNG